MQTRLGLGGSARIAADASAVEPMAATAMIAASTIPSGTARRPAAVTSSAAA